MSMWSIVFAQCSSRHTNLQSRYGMRGETRIRSAFIQGLSLCGGQIRDLGSSDLTERLRGRGWSGVGDGMHRKMRVGRCRESWEGRGSALLWAPNAATTS